MNKKQKNKKDIIKQKCFDFFFLGQCGQNVCYDSHQPFQGEKELENFYDIYKQKIFQNLDKNKSTDSLLQRYIIQQIKEGDRPLQKKSQKDPNLNKYIQAKFQQYHSSELYFANRVKKLIQKYCPDEKSNQNQGKILLKIVQFLKVFKLAQNFLYTFFCYSTKTKQFNLEKLISVDLLFKTLLAIPFSLFVLVFCTIKMIPFDFTLFKKHTNFSTQQTSFENLHFDNRKLLLFFSIFSSKEYLHHINHSLCLKDPSIFYQDLQFVIQYNLLAAILKLFFQLRFQSI